jgi:hypothetical protein
VAPEFQWWSTGDRDASRTGASHPSGTGACHTAGNGRGRPQVIGHRRLGSADGGERAPRPRAFSRGSGQARSSARYFRHHIRRRALIAGPCRSDGPPMHSQSARRHVDALSCMPRARSSDAPTCRCRPRSTCGARFDQSGTPVVGADAVRRSRPPPDTPRPAGPAAGRPTRRRSATRRVGARRLTRTRAMALTLVRRHSEPAVVKHDDRPKAPQKEVQRRVRWTTTECGDS